MELRSLTPDDKLAHRKLMSEAFSAGRLPASGPEDTASESKDEKQPPTLGIFEGSRLVASLTIEDLHVFWGNDSVPLGGIAGVACAADRRGCGHVGRLLTESLKTMRDTGQYLSGLFPFSVAFYRRFGWDWVGEKRTYTVPTSEIKAYSEGRHLQAYEGPDALDVVRPVHEAYARRYRSMATRTDPAPAFWEQALKHHDNRTTYVQVYRDPQSGEAEGYLTFRFPNDGDTGRVGEFFANTAAAYRGLLSVLHYYGTQVRRIRLLGPADASLPLYVMHNDLETKVSPLFMGRIVDAAAAFGALRTDPGLSGRVALTLTDEHADWNRRTFAVEMEGGQVTAAEVQEDPAITMDIQTLSQAYWGQPSLDQLRTSGRLSVTDEAQYALLARLLPPTVCYLQDGF